MNGIVAINKPSGLSSSDVVIRVRNALNKIAGYKVKCGHMGTLDPLASGVLLVGIGKCTRLFDYYLSKDKTYRSQFVFGKTTTTLDSQENVSETSELPKIDDIIGSIDKFVGEIEQIPPQFSAKSINGVRAYKLARAGQEVQLDCKLIKINKIDVIRSEIIGDCCQSIDIDINCGSGTYIRSLCRDIANACNTVGYMSYLIRLDCGGYNISNSPTLNEFLLSPIDYIENPKSAVQKLMPLLDIDEQYQSKMLNGVDVDIKNTPDGYFGAIMNNQLKGIAKNTNNIIRIVTTL